MHAWEGYALSTGAKKPDPKIPGEEDRKALRARIEREEKQKEREHG